MNHEILKRVILEQIEVIRAAEIIDREYSFENGVNYILVGLRRAGKSTLLYKIAREFVASGCDWSQIIYINFEDDRLLGFTKEDFDDIIETAYELSDADEIIYFFDHEPQCHLILHLLPFYDIPQQNLFIYALYIFSPVVQILSFRETAAGYVFLTRFFDLTIF